MQGFDLSFFKIVLAILGPLHFHMTFRISLSVSTPSLPPPPKAPKPLKDFYKNCVAPAAQQERFAVLTIVSLQWINHYHLVLSFSFSSFIIMNDVAVNTVTQSSGLCLEKGPYLRMGLPGEGRESHASWSPSDRASTYLE